MSNTAFSYFSVFVLLSFAFSLRLGFGNMAYTRGDGIGASGLEN